MGSNINLVCLCLVSHIFVLVLAKDLPSFVPKCYIDDPKLDTCLLEATEVMRPHLKKGVSQMGIPPFEPLKLKVVTMEQGTANLNFKANLTNMSVHGLTQYKFTDFKFDTKRIDKKVVHLIVKSKFDKLFIESEFNITGRIFIAPIQGVGELYINLTNVEADVNQTMYIERRISNGRRYLNLTDCTIKIKVGDAQPRLEGNFNGADQIAQLTNNVISQNRKEWLEELLPEIESIIKQLFKEIGEKIFGTTPFSKLLPKRKRNEQKRT